MWLINVLCTLERGSASHDSLVRSTLLVENYVKMHRNPNEARCKRCSLVENERIVLCEQTASNLIIIIRCENDIRKTNELLQQHTRVKNNIIFLARILFWHNNPFCMNAFYMVHFMENSAHYFRLLVFKSITRNSAWCHCA